MTTILKAILSIYLVATGLIFLSSQYFSFLFTIPIDFNSSRLIAIIFIIVQLVLLLIEIGSIGFKPFYNLISYAVLLFCGSLFFIQEQQLVAPIIQLAVLCLITAITYYNVECLRLRFLTLSYQITFSTLQTSLSKKLLRVRLIYIIGSFISFLIPNLLPISLGWNASLPLSIVFTITIVAWLLIQNLSHIGYKLVFPLMALFYSLTILLQGWRLDPPSQIIQFCLMGVAVYYMTDYLQLYHLARR